METGMGRSSWRRMTGGFACGGGRGSRRTRSPWRLQHLMQSSRQTFYSCEPDSARGISHLAGMKCATVLMGLLAMVGVASAKETVIEPKIESVGLFKNGLCVVKGSFAANEPGEFLWDEPPRAVHGTFLVESGGPV